MSLKRLAVLAAVQSDGSIVNNNMTSFSGARAGSSLHGNVNVLLSGAMLSGLILVVFLICYCCHRNMSKGAGGRSAQYWQEPEVPLEVFTVDGQCYEVAGVFLPPDPCSSPAPSPPPAYETVIATSPQEKDEKLDKEHDGLPTYEAALRLEAQGYV